MVERQAWSAVFISLVAVGAVVALGLSSFNQEAPAKSVHLISELTLPPPTKTKIAFIDSLVFSPDSRTLYAGYASEDLLVSYDASKNVLSAAIPDLQNVRSIAIIPEVQLGFTCNRRDKSIGVIDLKTRSLLRKIEIGGEPEAILYDEKAKLIYIADSSSKSGMLLDPITQKIVANIPLGGIPESVRADPKSGLVYQVLSDLGEVAVVAPTERAVIKRFKTTGCENPTGIALDVTRHRIFVVCENGVLLMMDYGSGEIIDSVPIGKGADTVDFDPKWRRVYTANGISGTMSVVEERSKDSCTKLEDFETYPGARALVVNPRTHKIYLSHDDKIAVYEPLKFAPERESQ